VNSREGIVTSDAAPGRRTGSMRTRSHSGSVGGWRVEVGRIFFGRVMKLFTESMRR